MLLSRMAAVPASYVLFYLIVLTQIVYASSQLPVSLSNFVPDCAAICVLSFLDVNFNGTRCESQQSLRCLCSTDGNTGFTLGEGVVQCMTAERKFGSCSANAVKQETIDEAYFMCDDQLGAIEPTHQVITASLLLPTVSGGPVRFPPLTETGGASKSTSLPTTLVTDTGSPAKPSSTTTERTTQLSTTRTSTDQDQTTKSTTDAASPPTATQDNDVGGGAGDDQGQGDGGSEKNLTTGQIAGISVGVGSAAVIAIGAIILARYCRRRRRHADVQTGILPRRSTWGYNLTGGGSHTTVNTNSIMANGVHHIQDDGDIPRPPMAYARTSYNRTSWRPEAIGLALSPGQQKKDTAPVAAARRLSKLLPAKPSMAPIFSKRHSSQNAQRYNETPPQLPPLVGLSYHHKSPSVENKAQPPVPLRLEIPQANTRPAVPKVNPVPASDLKLDPYTNPASNPNAHPNPFRGRESAVTEFEEDGGSSTLSPAGQIWRPPSSTPFTPGAYYVADGSGNWILANSAKASAVELPASIPPLPEPKSAPASGPKQPIAFPRVSRSIAGPHGPISAAKSTQSSSRQSLAPAADVRREPSSVYSHHSSIPQSLVYGDTDEEPVPDLPRRSLLRERRNSSQNSDITLFENSSDESKEPTPPEMTGSLSPVVEYPSPQSKAGRSPVSYPEIPGRYRNSITATRPSQPPPRRPLVYHPPGQPSPTLGLSYQQGALPASMSSKNTMPNKGRRPMDPPGLIRSGSPSTMRMVEPSPEPDDRGLLPSARAQGRPPSSLPRQRQSQSQVYPSPYGQRKSFQTRQEQGLPRQQPFQGLTRPSHNSHHYPTLNPNQPASHPESPTPPPLNISNRPPPQRFPPHQMQYKPYIPPQGQLGPPLDTVALPPSTLGSTIFQSPVSESSTSSSLLAKRLGSDRAAQMVLADELPNASRSRWKRDGMPVTPPQPDDVPLTPGWMPKLTPTRRGDDLYLNVQ